MITRCKGFAVNPNILCGIPLDIPMDELVTWKQLTGDRRLSDALAECDSGGRTRFFGGQRADPALPNIQAKAFTLLDVDPTSCSQ
jgi:hypothetical protein